MWFHNIISNVKSKWDTCKTVDEKISLLTLLPDHWKFKTVTQYFKCTSYMYTEAKKLKSNVGKYISLKRNPCEYSLEVNKHVCNPEAILLQTNDFGFSIVNILVRIFILYCNNIVTILLQGCTIYRGKFLFYIKKMRITPIKISLWEVPSI